MRYKELRKTTYWSSKPSIRMRDLGWLHKGSGTLDEQPLYACIISDGYCSL